MEKQFVLDRAFQSKHDKIQSVFQKRSKDNGENDTGVTDNIYVKYYILYIHTIKLRDELTMEQSAIKLMLNKMRSKEIDNE